MWEVNFPCCVITLSHWVSTVNPCGEEVLLWAPGGNWTPISSMARMNNSHYTTDALPAKKSFLEFPLLLCVNDSTWCNCCQLFSKRIFTTLWPANLLQFLGFHFFEGINFHRNPWQLIPLFMAINGNNVIDDRLWQLRGCVIRGEIPLSNTHSPVVIGG